MQSQETTIWSMYRGQHHKDNSPLDDEAWRVVRQTMAQTWMGMTRRIIQSRWGTATNRKWPWLTSPESFPRPIPNVDPNSRHHWPFSLPENIPKENPKMQLSLTKQEDSKTQIQTKTEHSKKQTKNKLIEQQTGQQQEHTRTPRIKH